MLCVQIGKPPPPGAWPEKEKKEKDMYANVKTSKLSFKGEKPKKSVKRPIDSLHFGGGGGGSSSSSSAPAAKGAAADDEEEEEEEEAIQVVVGSGRITSSGTTIHGHDGTKFTTELAVNDAIVVSHPTSFVDETKIVRMVLSNVSISVSSAFSSDLISTTAFRFVKAPKKFRLATADEPNETGDERMKKLKLDAEEQAFGTYASAGGNRLVYREKLPGAAGTYRIVEKQMKGPVSREQLLSLRSKKKSDRHCV